MCSAWPQVQTAFRAHAARTAFVLSRRAALIIQALCRGRQCRQLLARGRAAGTVQRYTRRMLAMRRLRDARRAAVRIQAAVRMHQQRER